MECAPGGEEFLLKKGFVYFVKAIYLDKQFEEEHAHKEDEGGEGDADSEGDGRVVLQGQDRDGAGVYVVQEGGVWVGYQY